MEQEYLYRKFIVMKASIVYDDEHHRNSDVEANISERTKAITISN